MAFTLKGAFNNNQANEQTLNLYSFITNQEGVLYGFEVTAETIPSLNLNVATGYGFINGNNSFQRYPFISETTQLLGFSSPPPAGQDRHDLIVVKFTIVNSNETTAQVTIVEGTPALAGTQVDPNLVEASNIFYFVLARVRVIGASAQITNSQITQTGSSTRPGHNNTFAVSATVFPIYQRAYIEASYQEAGRFVEDTGDTMSGMLQFSGTSHVGLRLNNLTTVQRDALGVVPLGSSIFNTDTSSNDVYSAAGWIQGLTQKQINATKIFVEQNFA